MSTSQTPPHGNDCTSLIICFMPTTPGVPMRCPRRCVLDFSAPESARVCSTAVSNSSRIAAFSPSEITTSRTQKPSRSIWLFIVAKATIYSNPEKRFDTCEDDVQLPHVVRIKRMGRGATNRRLDQSTPLQHQLINGYTIEPFVVH